MNTKAYVPRVLVRNNAVGALFMYREDDFRLAPDWPLRSDLEVLGEARYDRKTKTLTALGTEYLVYADGSVKEKALATMSPADALAEHVRREA